MLLGLTVMSGWLLQQAVMVQIRPGHVGMVFNTALSFILTGIALLILNTQYRWRATAQATIGWILISLAALVLLENSTNLKLTLSLPSLHQWLSDGNPNPGRMAPNTSLGFMLCGWVLLLMRRVEKKLAGAMVQLATYGVLAIGFTGLAGYSFHLELLYSWLHAVRMALPTALGMILAGIGLRLSWHRADWYQSGQHFKEDEKITLISASILTVVALTTGLAAFSAYQNVMEKFIGESLTSTLHNRVAIFQLVIKQRDISAKRNTIRPDLIQVMHRLDKQPQDAAALQQLVAIGNGMLASGFTGLSIQDTSHREILRLGQLIPSAEISVDLGLPQPTFLRWDGGYYLNSQARIQSGSDKTMGTLTLEQPLPLITEQFAEGGVFGETGELALCLGQEQELLCFPQRFNPHVSTLPQHSISGSRLPMSYAVEGQSGVIQTLDYRGHQVIAAYGHTGVPGLGIVVKQDVAELYQPIRNQLQWALPMLFLFVAGGVLVLRSQVKPLASKLLRAEAEATKSELGIRAVVDNIGDGIVTYNEHSIIESFNAAAANIFGYSAAEVIGHNIQLLMPPEMRPEYETSMHRYLTDGTTRIIGKPNVNLPGMRKDGTAFQLEVTITETWLGNTRSFVGIVRDITARKWAEAALLAEKERLRVTLSSIGDAVITTDTAGKVTYLNPVAENMTGWINQDALGLPLPQVFNIVNEETGEVAPNPVELVLLHKRTSGLAESTLLIHRVGTTLAIEDSAAPILDRQGEIIGVVLVFHDVTAARKMAAQMTHQATHDALTGLINRREFERRVELA